MTQNNFYITTPIYYPSGEPHMGHAYSSILADVFARFMRNDNLNVFFLTGTDEHGLKIQKAAEKNNSEPLEYCNQISKIFKDLKPGGHGEVDIIKAIAVSCDTFFYGLGIELGIPKRTSGHGRSVPRRHHMLTLSASRG